MEHRDIHSQWDYPPVSSSWSWQAEGTAASRDIFGVYMKDNTHGVPHVNHSASADSSRSIPHINHSATASFGSPSFDSNSDKMTHNIKLSITTVMGNNTNSSLPDGLGVIRYREPNTESFIFDQKKGFRFDPTTGLHYDANSGFFINHELEILLRWDPLYSTYIRAGDLARLRPTVDMNSSSGNLYHTKRERIDRSTSRSRSGSLFRGALNSHRMCISRSRSRSVSSGKNPNGRRPRSRSFCGRRKRYRSRSRSVSSGGKPKGRRPRSRSIGRGRKCYRSRSRSMSSGGKPKGRHPRSRSIGRRRKCYRSRSRSLSSGEKPKVRRPRSRSICRSRKRYRSRSQSVNNSNLPKSRRPRSRSVIGTRKHCKSRSGSAISSEQPRTNNSRETQCYRSSCRNALRSHSLSRESCSRSPSLQEGRSGRTPVTINTNQHCELERSQSGETKKKRDVWNRLGPSPKRQISVSSSYSDSEKQSWTLTTRSVHLVHTYDGERSRSEDLSKDGNHSSVVDRIVVQGECQEALNDLDELHENEVPDNQESEATKVEIFDCGDVDDSPNNTHSNIGTWIDQYTQKMGKNRSPHYRNIKEKEAPYLKEENPDDTPKVSSSGQSKRGTSMTRRDSREVNQANIGEAKRSSSRVTRSRSRGSARGSNTEPRRHHISVARQSHSGMYRKQLIRVTRSSPSRETRSSYNRVVRQTHDREHRRRDAYSPRHVKTQYCCCSGSCHGRMKSDITESRRSFPLSLSPVKKEPRSRSGSVKQSSTSNIKGHARSLSRETRRKSYVQTQLDLKRKIMGSTKYSFSDLSTARRSSVDVKEVEKSHCLSASRVSARSSYREPQRSHNWRARSPDRVYASGSNRESRRSHNSPVARKSHSGMTRAHLSQITRRSRSKELRRSRDREHGRNDSCSRGHVKREHLCYNGCQIRCRSYSTESRWRHSRDRDMSFSLSPSPDVRESGSRSVSIQRRNQKTTSNDSKEHVRSLYEGTQRKSNAQIQFDPCPKRNSLGSTEKSSSDSPTASGSQSRNENNEGSSCTPDESTVMLDVERTPNTEDPYPKENIPEETPVWKRNASQCHNANNHGSASIPNESTAILDRGLTPEAEAACPRDPTPEDTTVQETGTGQSHSATNQDSPSTPIESAVILDDEPTPNTEAPYPKENITKETPVWKRKASHCHNANNHGSASIPDETTAILDKERTRKAEAAGPRDSTPEDATIGETGTGHCLGAANQDSSSAPVESTVILDDEPTPNTEAPDPKEKMPEETLVWKTTASQCHNANNLDSSSSPDETTANRDKERIGKAEAADPRDSTPEDTTVREIGACQCHSANNQDLSSAPVESAVILDDESASKTTAPDPKEKFPEETPVGKRKASQSNNANSFDSSSIPDETTAVLDEERTNKAEAADPREQIPEGTTVRKLKTGHCHSANKQNSSSSSDEPTIVLDDEPATKTEAPDPKEKIPKDSPVVTVIDNGDVLGHLFTRSSQTLSNILLVAPVPLQNNSRNAGDALKNQLGEPKDLLRVYVSYQNTSGSSCHFMMISFKSANAAKQWHDSLNGTIALCGEDGLMLKGYLHFLKKGNWNCKHCKSFNFFMQSLCSKCYQPKDIGFSPVTISVEPTTWVGIARLDSKFSSTKKVTDSLPPLDDFNIVSIDMISEPSGLSLGLCVFEVENAEEGTKLFEFFLHQERKALYLMVNEKPKSPDEEYMSLLFDKVTPSNILLVALIPMVTDPDIKFELSLLEIYLSMLLKEDGMNYEQISLHVDKNVGSPYSYALITFADTERAAQWSKLRRKSLNNFRGQYQSFHSRTSKKRSTVSLHFSEANWECHGCHSLNFSLRSLCHHCFKHKLPYRFGSISQTSTATRWLAVSEFSNWSKGDEHIVEDFRELLKEFILKKIEVLRDSEHQSLPLACVFEMQGKGESLRLKEYLNKEGRFSVFVVIHKELDRHPSTYHASAPDVMIVEAPPPECIDLTSEEIAQKMENGESVHSETPTTDHPSSVPSVNTVSKHDLTKEITFSADATATAPICGEQPPESIDLTSEANPSHLEDQAKTASSPDATPSVVDQPPQINPTSQDDCTQNSESAGPSMTMKPVLEKLPPASMDVAANVKITKNAGKPTKKKRSPRKTKAPRLPKIMTQSDVISVGPVPWLGENTQWLYALAFLNYGAEYKSVQFCQGDLFGLPYNYCLVYFMSPQLAKKWYEMERRGFIKITNQSFPSIKVENFKPFKAFLNLSGRNWRCDCGRENFWKRSFCHRCYKHRGKKIATLIPSLTPTKYLAIKLFNWYPVAELASIFPKTRCMMCDVVAVKFISDPNVKKDKFGIYIFETRSLEGTIMLRDYYKQSLVVQSTSFVVLKDYSSGVAIDLGSPTSPAVSLETSDIVCNTAHVSGPPDILGKPKPDYEAIIWTSFFGFHLNKPPTKVVMISLCLECRELPDETRVQIQDSLKKVGVTSESIIYSFKGDVGSPFSYCLISFESVQSAKTWFDKCNDDTFQFEVSRPDGKKIPHRIQDCYSQKSLSNGDVSYCIKSKLHYSFPNWLCICGTPNFPLRSVCHSCFKNKNKETGYSVACATKFVGIKLTEYLETVDTSTLYDIRQLGFNVSKINIGLDPAVPRDLYGIVIFEMESINEGIKFHQFLLDIYVSGSQKRSKKQDNNIISNLKVILNNSSGITFLKCQS